ncbi:MAG TPA: zinc-ribbon domain-containing protein [Terriglobia bacterium]|nr:zinc-ribbon domain-containing protein [Terriglobia bacterium]
MRFCRYCGAPIPEDSLFCPKCGKRLGRRPHPRLDRLVSVLRLNTPYPYFAILIVALVVWIVVARQPGIPAFDYSQMEWSIEPKSRTGPDSEGAYHQIIGLVLENKSTDVQRDIPVELTVRVDPAKPADVSARFGGRDLALSAEGKPAPLTLLLVDPIQPGVKRLFPLEATIRAQPPFTVIYEFRDRDSKKTLVRYATEP